MIASRTLTALGVVTAMLVPLIGFSAPVAHAAVESPTTDLVDDDADAPGTPETMFVPDVDSETDIPAPSDVPYLAPTLPDQDRSEEPEVVGAPADIRADLPVATFVAQPKDQHVSEGEKFNISVSYETHTLAAGKSQQQFSDDEGQTWRTTRTAHFDGKAPPGAIWFSGWTDVATAAHDGRLVRLRLEVSDQVLISDAARMTVEPLPLYVLRHPASVTVTEGGSAVFSAASGMTAPTTQQWWRSNNGGNAWAPIAGETDLTLSVGPTTPEMDSLQYRILLTGATGSVWSDAATLTVRPRTAPLIVAHPQDKTSEAGKVALFQASATDPELMWPAWQYSPDGVEWIDLDVSPSDTPLAGMLAIHSSPSLDGMRYRAVYTNHLGTATTNPAILTITAAPVISEHPTNTSVIAGQPATFSAATPAVSPNRSQQWQSSTDGETWMDVPGATDASLTTDSTTFDQDGSLYRIVFSNATGSTASEPATLTVHTTPPGASLIVTPTVVLVDRLP